VVIVNTFIIFVVQCNTVRKTICNIFERVPWETVYHRLHFYHV